MSNGTVLVTGAKGFLAAHVIEQLIAQDYRVLGTVRTRDKGEFYVRRYGAARFAYHVVRDCDVLRSFQAVFLAHGQHIRYVVHTASPAFYNGQDPERDVMQPAVAAVLGVLRAAKEFGAPDVLRKVVITSSVACVLQQPPRLDDAAMVYDETMWNPISLEEASGSMQSAYFAARVFAEKAVWKFVRSEAPPFAVTTVQLPLVLGPPINDLVYQNLQASNEFLLQLITDPQRVLSGLEQQEEDDAPFTATATATSTTARLSTANQVLPETFPFYVDVRDAAATHVRALTATSLDNKRCLSVAGVADSRRIVRTLCKVCPEFTQFLSPQLRADLDNNNSNNTQSFAQFDTTASRTLLGMEYLPLERSVYDTVVQVRELERRQAAGGLPSP